MELHIQKCQNCGSRNVRNILVREQAQKVFVQCRDCSGFVARYIIGAGAGYYHAGKDFESFLRSIERDGWTSSGRDLHAWFNEIEEKAEQEFESLLVELKERYGDNMP